MPLRVCVQRLRQQELEEQSRKIQNLTKFITSDKAAEEPKSTKKVR